MEGCGWHVGKPTDVRVDSEEKESRNQCSKWELGRPKFQGQSYKQVGHLRIWLGCEKTREPQQFQQQISINWESNLNTHQGYPNPEDYRF